MSESINFNGKKWIPENELYILSILEGFNDMFNIENSGDEIIALGYDLEDLLVASGIIEIQKKLSEKYPIE
jgi:hypothetical protein